MLHGVKFLKDFRCFKKDETLEFRPGINLLVGEQGTGKSTLLDRIKTDGKSGGKAEVLVVDASPIAMMAFDFEKDTPRGKSHFNDSMSMMAQVSCLFISHGQMNNALLSELEKQKGILFLMDEPDMALSIRSCTKLVKLLKKAEENKCQVLAAVHNPIIIGAFSEVLSLEHRKWMPSKDFINEHMGGES